MISMARFPVGGKLVVAAEERGREEWFRIIDIEKSEGHFGS